MTRNRSLTIGVLVSAFAIFLAWQNQKPQTKIEKHQPIVATHVAAKPKLKIKDREQAPSPAISPEVQHRLATAGFKTDSFIAVKTKKNEK